jgi:hypothetical protein
MKFVNLSEHQGKNQMDRRPAPTQSVTFTRGLSRGESSKVWEQLGEGFQAGTQLGQLLQMGHGSTLAKGQMGTHQSGQTAANGSWTHDLRKMGGGGDRSPSPTKV